MEKEVKPIKLEDVKKVPKRDIEEHDRLNVLLQVHHEHCCVDPVSAQCKFVALLEQMEEPFKRLLKIGKDWQPLEYGWIDPKQSGYVVLLNLSGHKHRLVNPTLKEKKLDQKMIIELGVELESEVCPYAIVRPGRVAFLEMIDIEKMRVRCSAAKPVVEAHVFVFTK